MTDRQRWNWYRAIVARDALKRLNSGNTESVCDGIPFLHPEERKNVEIQIHWLDGVIAELEGDRRSRATDRTQLITVAGEEIHPGTARIVASA